MSRSGRLWPPLPLVAPARRASVHVDGVEQAGRPALAAKHTRVRLDDLQSSGTPSVSYTALWTPLLDRPIDVGGWTVSDEGDHLYTVPSGFTLDPAETVTLYTGSGSNTDSEVYWGSGRAIWNDNGDTRYERDGVDVVLEEPN